MIRIQYSNDNRRWWEYEKHSSLDACKRRLRALKERYHGSFWRAVGRKGATVEFDAEPVWERHGF